MDSCLRAQKSSSFLLNNCWMTRWTLDAFQLCLHPFDEVPSNSSLGMQTPVSLFKWEIIPTRATEKINSFISQKGSWCLICVRPWDKDKVQCQRQSSSPLGVYVLVGAVRGWISKVWAMEQGLIYRALWVMTRSSYFILFIYLEGWRAKNFQWRVRDTRRKTNKQKTHKPTKRES